MSSEVENDRIFNPGSSIMALFYLSILSRVFKTKAQGLMVKMFLTVQYSEGNESEMRQLHFLCTAVDASAYVS